MILIPSQPVFVLSLFNYAREETNNNRIVFALFRPRLDILYARRTC